MRLQLTRRGDYAIRAMIVLAQESDVVTGAEIARRTSIPEHLVGQVMSQLVQAGLVRARLGRRGGYRLADESSAIPILAIVEAVEGDARRQRCVLRGLPCDVSNRCQVHDIFASAQDALISRLAEASLATVVAQDADTPQSKS
jgi:Rrf2 family nitric oxide-sensitive transcriptional repressor